MPTTTSTRTMPVMQIRVIGVDRHAQAVLADAVRRARTLLGPNVTYRTQTRPNRRAGYVRVYLTATRKEARRTRKANDPYVNVAQPSNDTLIPNSGGTRPWVTAPSC